MGPLQKLFLPGRFSIPAIFTGINLTQLTDVYEFILLEIQKTHEISGKYYYISHRNHRL